MREATPGWNLSPAVIVLLLLTASCNMPVAGKLNTPQPTLQPTGRPTVQPSVQPTVDYSQFEPISDEAYYADKTIGEIFMINTETSGTPAGNSMTVFAKVPFTVHPDQDMSAFEFKDPLRPTVLSGLGQGWGKLTIYGYGNIGSSECTGEFKVSVSLIGGMYPSPTCELDVMRIETIYIPSGEDWVCKVNGVQVAAGPMPEDVFDAFGTFEEYSVGLYPITFSPPEDDVVQLKRSILNIDFDLNYYLIDFNSRPMNFSGPKVSYYTGDIGCDNFTLQPPDFGTYLPEELRQNLPGTPNIWDDLLIPDSERESTKP